MRWCFPICRDNTWSRLVTKKGMPTLRSCQREANFPSIDELRSWRGRRRGSWGKLWKIKQRNQEMICESILCIHTRTFMHYRQADVHLAHIYTAHKAPNNSGNSQGDEIAFVCVWFREPWLSSNCCSVNRCLKTLPRPTVFLWDFFYKPQVLCVRTDVQEWSETRCWRSEAEGIQCSIM